MSNNNRTEKIINFAPGFSPSFSPSYSPSLRLSPSLTPSLSPSLSPSSAPSSAPSSTPSSTLSTCKFSNFPVAYASACISESSNNCVNTKTKIFSLKGEYNCLCPPTYMMNKKEIESSNANKLPILTADKVKGNTIYNVSCK
jgi:hypothetical protein